MAQLTVTTGLSAAQMAAILTDPAVTISNAILKCNSQASGSFSNTGATLGQLTIAQGIILCTGKAKESEGPNKDDATRNVVPSDQVYATTAWSTANTPDADLQALTGGVKRDLCSLEMDIKANADSVFVDYIFGSEEYETYIGGGTYNDVFGFFISGPGITGNPNFALVPNTSSIVSVNSINANNNFQYYIRNLPPTTGSKAGTVQYNGITKLLRAKFKIQPGGTYHLKFAIADNGDSNVDSGVFLKGGSIKVLLSAQLANFIATLINHQGVLTWTTTSEKNNKAFEILRSGDGRNFDLIGMVEGAGNASIAHHYRFTDYHPLKGANYYRLRQVDYDGKPSWSNIEFINNLNGFKNFTIVPNPVRDAATLNFESALNSTAVLTIYDFAGKIIFTENFSASQGSNSIALNMSALPKGIFYGKITTEFLNSETIKIIK